MVDPIEIQLSQEELLYLLRSLDLPDLPGMGEHPWGHITQETAPLVMETAGRGLVARGLVTFGETKVAIDEMVNKLLVTAAYPKQMVVLNYSQGGPDISLSFYRGDEFDIKHRQPYPWIHHFETLTFGDMGLSLIRELLKDVKMEPATKAFLIQQAKLDEIRQIPEMARDSAVEQLMLAGLTVSEATRFAKVLAQPELKVLVLAVYNLKGEIRQNMLTILADKVSCWVVSAGQQVDGMAQVMGMDRQRLDAVLQTIYLPLQLGKENIA